MKDSENIDIFSGAEERAALRQKAENKVYAKILVEIFIFSSISILSILLLSSNAKETYCAILDYKIINFAWPSNIKLMDQFINAQSNYYEVCRIIAIRAIFSWIFLIYIVVLLFRQLFWKNDFYVAGSILPLVVFAVASIAASFIPASQFGSIYRLSINPESDGNVLKSSLNIFGFYVSLAFIVVRLFAFIRSGRSKI